MVTPTPRTFVSPDCLKGFETARKLPPHKQSDDIVLASRILRSLQYADSRTWQILQADATLTQDDARDLYDSCRLFLSRATAKETPVYGSLLKRMEDVFERAATTLEDRIQTHNDIADNGLFSARTGLCFVRSLIAMESRAQGNVVKIDHVNPFLMVHVAAEVLHDIDRDIAGRRQLFWEERTDLYKNMHGYCRDLHELIPVGLEPQQASTRQFHDALDALIDLHQMIFESQEAKMYIAVLPEQRQHLGILQNYIAPFGKQQQPYKPYALQSEATTLQWNDWAPRAKEARARRDERHAAMPKSFFSEMDPFIR